MGQIEYLYFSIDNNNRCFLALCIVYSNVMDKMYIYVYSCFISDPRVQYGIFLAPLFTIVIFNVVILALVTRVLFRHNKRKKKENSTSISQMSKMVTSIISIMVLFGTSWLFGAFSINAGAKVFQWLFLIFNTTQGFCLFLFLCIINNDGRDEWKKLLTCYNPKKSRAKGNSSHSTNRMFKKSVSDSKQTKNTYVTHKESTIKYLSNSDQFTSMYDTCTDIELRENSFVPQQQDIKGLREKSFVPELQGIKESLIISNEQIVQAPPKGISKVDIQLPPHVMIKLRQQQSKPNDQNKKQKKRKRRSGVTVTNAIQPSRKDSQVPPHVLERFRQPTVDYQSLISSQCSFTDNGFSQVSHMGSQPNFTQMTEIYPLSEEDGF